MEKKRKKSINKLEKEIHEGEMGFAAVKYLEDLGKELSNQVVSNLPLEFDSYLLYFILN